MSRLNIRLSFLIVAAVLLFTAVALFLGVPGPDWNACNIYDVKTALAKNMTYTLSRTPGQPLLDYLNFISWSIGGDIGIQIWFLLVSTTGIIALYQLIRQADGTTPLIAAATLALNPLFLTNIGGIGDFAVSLSFLIIALWAATRRKLLTAGVALAMATGCRLVFCLYVIPLAAVVGMVAFRKGESKRRAITDMSVVASTAAALSLFLYAPLFAFWGAGLLHNLPFRGLTYHLPAFAFKLWVSLGICFWILVSALAVSRTRDRHRWLSTIRRQPLAIAGLLIIGCCAVILFRVPTKPELTLPIVLGTILVIQLSASRVWAYGLLAASCAAGLIVISPYCHNTGVYGWHIEEGWYMHNAQQAYDNRFHLDDVRMLLTGVPSKTLLVTLYTWTSDMEKQTDIEPVSELAGITGLATARRFAELGPERIVVSIQEPKLRELLEAVGSVGSRNRMAVVYEESYQGLLRRWDEIDLPRYGRSVKMGNDPVGTLWTNFCARLERGTLGLRAAAR